MVVESFLVGLAAALAGVLVMALLVGVYMYLEYDHYPRIRLTRSVRRLRLFKMLQLLGIPFHLYMKLVPVRDIQRHVHNCRRCQELSTCDRCLELGHCVTDMEFCPNFTSLVTFRAPQ